MRAMFRPATDQPACRTPVFEVAVREDLDAWSTERIHYALREALAVRPQLLVIDLTDCPSIDEAGVALVLDVHRRASRIGVTVALRSPSSWLRLTLEQEHGQVLQTLAGSVDDDMLERPGRHHASAGR
jgi:anti-sigma B factor antagonist